MTCERCHGLMVCDHPLIFQSKSDYRADGVDLRAELTAWRCVCCWNVVDLVILCNRLARKSVSQLPYLVHRVPATQEPV